MASGFKFYYLNIGESEMGNNDWIERNALEWKLRIMSAIALLGWVGFVLALMGV